jgi:biopolymer transport protein ExbD
MIRRKRKFEEVKFALTPMIDVTFLLLIFFMVTTRISKEQFKREINLPIASNAVVPSDLKDRDIISLGEDGTFFLRDEPLSDADLASYMKVRYQEYPPLRLYVRADAETDAARIKKLMGMAADAGAQDVIFASYQNP